jgi:hypothetical protein
MIEVELFLRHERRNSEMSFYFSRGKAAFFIFYSLLQGRVGTYSVCVLYAKKTRRNKGLFSCSASCEDFYTHSHSVKEIDLHGFQRCHFLDS